MVFMPSPIGHSIISLGLYPLLKNRLSKIKAFIFILIFGNLPDIDFLPGILIGNLNIYHQEYTHTLGFLILTAIIVWISLKSKDKAFFTSIAISLISLHFIADYFNMDTRPPIGLRIFWPFLERHFYSPIPIFTPLDRSSLKNIFCLYNIKAGLLELTISVAIFLLLYTITNRVHEKK